MTADAITAPLSPNILIRAAVAMAEAEILARLLPSSKAPIKRSGKAVSLSAIEARFEPRRAISVRRARDVAVRPVSAPEKNAETKIRQKMDNMA